VLLIDTHVLVWLAADDARLGARAKKRLTTALGSDGVGVSAITFWEVAMLHERGRLKLRQKVEALRAAALKMPLEEVVVDGRIAILAANLGSFHGDPVDRIIAATALERGATLVTSDERLLAWRGGAKLLDASD